MSLNIHSWKKKGKNDINSGKKCVSSLFKNIAVVVVVVVVDVVVVVENETLNLDFALEVFIAFAVGGVDKGGWYLFLSLGTFLLPLW